jgi:hypothetical protein
VVLSPGVNDAAQLERTFTDLYGLGGAVLSVSVVPVGLTEYSKHSLVREPTAPECRAAVHQVEVWQQRARDERNTHWVYGADELYLRAGLELPSESTYGDFEQVENGVGSVRYLQRRIRQDASRFQDWSGLRIGVVTGTSMGALMPQVLEPLARSSGACFELIVVENRLFGPRVTTAGLLPGKDIAAALRSAPRFDRVLLPAESVNDDLRFIDRVLPPSPRKSALPSASAGTSPTHSRAWQPDAPGNRRHCRPAQRGEVHPLQPDPGRALRNRRGAGGHHTRSALRLRRMGRAPLLAHRYRRAGSRFQ